MSFSQGELDALRSAYASGVLRVTHEGKTVEYGSEADLLRRIKVVERAIGTTVSAGQKRRTTVYLQFSRG